MNWGALKAAVAAYMHRPDLAPLMPYFLELAENRIFRGEINTQPIRVSGMVQSVSQAVAARPADFLEAKVIHENGEPRKVLTFYPLESLPTRYRAFSWEGENLRLSDDQAFPVQLIYYARPASPVADADENWIMAQAPNVYLSSICVEVARWMRDDQLGAREAMNYASAAQAFSVSDQRAQISGSLPTAFVKGAV